MEVRALHNWERRTFPDAADHRSIVVSASLAAPDVGLYYLVEAGASAADNVSGVDLFIGLHQWVALVVVLIVLQDGETDLLLIGEALGLPRLFAHLGEDR